MAQPLNPNLSELNLLVTWNQIYNHNGRAIPGLVQGLLN
jgi:hypothetical protein